MKAKEWLVNNGHLKEVTRGRLSLANRTLVENAVASGVSIEGYSSSPAPRTNVTKSSPESAPKATRQVRRESVTSDIIEPVPYRFTEEEFVVFERVDGKKVMRSLRDACNNCGVSLVACYCQEPTIVARDSRGTVRVYIERK